jgi:hypothetical protein
MGWMDPHSSLQLINHILIKMRWIHDDLQLTQSYRHKGKSVQNVKAPLWDRALLPQSSSLVPSPQASPHGPQIGWGAGGRSTPVFSASPSMQAKWWGRDDLDVWRLPLTVMNRL